MKKIVTILVLLVTFNFSFSQEQKNKNSKEQNLPTAKKEKEYNTWSVNFNFGTNIPVGPFNEGYYALTDDFFTQPEFNHFDFNVRKMFNTKFGLMLDLGYDNFDNSKTNGFLVENSWGEKSGFEGNYYMANSWFEDYTYEVVVDKKCVPKKILNLLNQKPIILPYWTPFSQVLMGGK